MTREPSEHVDTHSTKARETYYPRGWLEVAADVRGALVCSRAGESSELCAMQPADLWLYHQSTEKRRRLSMGQTPITPAKAENKPEPSKSAHARQSAEAYRPESPSLELSEGEDTESNIELLPGTRIKVGFQALQQTGASRCHLAC